MLEPTGNRHRRKQRPFDALRQTISFDDVSFTYAGFERQSRPDARGAVLHQHVHHPQRALDGADRPFGAPQDDDRHLLCRFVEPDWRLDPVDGASLGEIDPGNGEDIALASRSGAGGRHDPRQLVYARHRCGRRAERAANWPRRMILETCRRATDAGRLRGVNLSAGQSSDRTGAALVRDPDIDPRRATQAVEGFRKRPSSRR